MDIKEFKGRCELRKRVQDEKEKRWALLRDIQGRKYLPGCFNPKTKWNWKKLKYDELCPNCGTILNKEIIKSTGNGEASWNDVIYYCPCGYEYAR